MDFPSFFPGEWVDFQSKFGRSQKEEAIWVFLKIGVSQNGWFIMENPIKLDDLGVPLFLETSIWNPFLNLLTELLG